MILKHNATWLGITLSLASIIGCKYSRKGQATAATTLVSVPERSDWTISTSGLPYSLNLKHGALTFCDNRGARTFGLQTGQDTASTQKCTKPEFFHGVWTGCDDQNLNMDVQSSQAKKDDFITFNGFNYLLQGRADECDNDGMIAVFGTAEEVVLVDGQSERSAILSHDMGQPVAIGSGWVAWCPKLQDKLQLVRESKAIWQKPE